MDVAVTHAGAAAAEFSARAFPGFLQSLGSTSRFLCSRLTQSSTLHYCFLNNYFLYTNAVLQTHYWEHLLRLMLHLERSWILIVNPRESFKKTGILVALRLLLL
jgi:hypothetical protein